MVANWPWKRIGVAALLVAEVAVLAVVAWSAQGGPTFGIAVRSGDGSIQMSDQRNVVHQVTVHRVVAPVDGWLIVQANLGGAPDAILGSVWVPKGESSDVKIEIGSPSRWPTRILVTLLADMGAPHVLEYSTASRSGMGPTLGTGGSSSEGGIKDKPIIAGGKVVSADVALDALTFNVEPGARASLSDTTRTVDTTAVLIPSVVAPAQSWVSVSLETTSGQIRQVLGRTLVHSGEQTRVVVALSSRPGRSQLLATLHVDLGTLGQFDFSPLDFAKSPDQPYVAGGQTVSVPIRTVR